MDCVAGLSALGVVVAGRGTVCNVTEFCSDPAIFRLFVTDGPDFGRFTVVDVWFCRRHAEQANLPSPTWCN